MFKCSICKKTEDGFGHNPEPIFPYEKRCCSDCNQSAVVPMRIWGMEAYSAIVYLKKQGIVIRYETRGRR